MKTNMKIATLVYCLALFTGIALAETESTPQPPIIRVDESNSWATLGRLYVIIATTDNDETFGKVTEKNGNVIDQLFRTHTAQKAVTVLKIPPQNISRQTVLSLIANLPLREEDAVVFYYSGKGDIDRRHGQYFELSTAKEELYRSEVRSAILKKNVRLCVLLADCCDLTAASSVSNENKDNVSAGVAETSPLFFSLFFWSRGVIDVNSASTGQASCAGKEQVGCFTEMLAGLLNINRNKILSWQRGFPYLQEGTSLVFTNNFPDGADLGEDRQQKNQIPVLLQLGGNDIDSPTRLRIYPAEADPSADATVNTDEQRREEDRQIVLKLVQQAVGDLRPFDAEDRGTHENLKALDTDNTILGLDGEPFSKRIPPIVVASSADEGVQTPPVQQRVRLGIQAADRQGEGVAIVRVVPNLPGSRAGLVAGDVIIEIDGKKINSEKEYSDAIDAATDKITIVTRDRRSGRPIAVTINIKETSAE